MRTRVRPYEYNVHSSHKWAVEIFDLHEKNGAGKWITNSVHRYFWKANLRSYRLARWSLEVKQNPKEKFIERLKNGDE